MAPFTAIFEKGVFRPLQSVPFTEDSEVTLLIELPKDTEVEAGLSAPLEDCTPAEAEVQRQLALVPFDHPQADVYRLLSLRYDGGDPLAADDHNRHQP